MNNRKYMIFNMSEVDNIDFSQVMEYSEETLRKSLDNTKTIVKWIGSTIPTSINSLITKEGPYTSEEILTILETSEWSEQDLNNI